ncbi:MAG: cytochrome c biogenesis protein CcsA [Psychroflexus sp.]|uniref:Cytochrome C biogenesis protein n=2 Tax=Mesohalobacter halotolerans TaxID=1883405 RepID=A0A4U5TS26_9FLAO|nr:cytochrome c biogenesis protein CcsA [Psychroflexus sp.]TKS56822.1 cytochrome C biogenesis protein [Mesohalobacter halotolerans]
MAMLFIIFALAMAIGTFVENSYTTLTAREWIYNAWWFEVIMAFFVINFLGNIARFKLWRREKWTTLLFHLSFILILVGAFVTRYIGFEGIMPIREGEVENTMLSRDVHLTTYIDGEINGQARRRSQHFPLVLSDGLDNNKIIETNYNGIPVTFEVLKFIPDAKMGIVENPQGTKHLKIVESGDGQRHEHYLKKGEVANIHNTLFAYNKQTEGAINITENASGEFNIKSPFEGQVMRMADQNLSVFKKDSLQALKFRSLYSIGQMQFVIPEMPIKGEEGIVKSDIQNKDQPDGVILKVSTQGEADTLNLIGGRGMLEPMTSTSVGDFDISVRYGSKILELPFAIKLNDFIAEKHPGTEDRANPSYKSFKSKVQVVDGSQSYPYEIYMNHVLDHKGYRFFQSSFDPDELGTVLSVNHDFWGTWITYIGYFLLYLGLMLILIDKGSRFGKLRQQLEKIKAKKAKLISVFLILFSLSGLAQNTESNSNQNTHEVHKSQNSSPMAFNAEKFDSLILANAVDAKHAAKFGKLVVQDEGGRMKPMNTFSSELLRKLSHKDTYKSLNSDQVMLSMIENPVIWYTTPLIYLKSRNDSLHHVLGIEEGKKYATLTDFFNPDGSYKLSPFLDEAYRAKVRNQFEKDFVKADQRVNLFYDALQGKLLKIFPIPEHPNNKWVSRNEAIEENYFSGMDSVYTRQILPIYMQRLQTARQSNDYTKADEILVGMKNFQKRFGSKVMLSDQKVDVEVLYNEVDIFNRLYKYYLLAGVLMIFVVLYRIFKQNKLNLGLLNVFKITLVLLWIAHTLGLVARWYISGHAPWSNAYESMIYVAWASMFFGLAFGRKSDLTMASTAFVTSIILWVAHMNWVDPSIANLQPVLDSYWLMIHVAVIVASYGPFTLSMIIGLVALILLIITTKKNKKKLDLNIKELTVINEISLTVGLVMLTIGNFLGGQWANESWGRYWGWDPKETWALISIIIYAFVIHMRFVPGLRGRFAFNWASVIAFGSILMTYFGVNFYLTGLHSYASGDQIISYQFIIITLVALLILGYFARRQYLKHYKK